MIAATILAAGASSRMGYPKALLEFRGRTFLQTILDTTAAVVPIRCVALGGDAEKVVAQHDLGGITTVTNREMAAGPIGSVRATIRALEHLDVDALLVWPVDYPLVSAGTVTNLIQRFGEPDGPAIVMPEYAGQGGHPVLFGERVFNELLEAPDSQGARAVVRRDAMRVVRLEVTDGAVVDSLNTREAYEELLRRDGS